MVAAAKNGQDRLDCQRGPENISANVEISHDGSGVAVGELARSIVEKDPITLRVFQPLQHQHDLPIPRSVRLNRGLSAVKAHRRSYPG